MTMWRVLLNLLAATRRPLVVLDFETAGLSGAPPVEFCTLIFSPWETPEQDEVTARARAECPPGLTYAAVQRLDPLRPIDAGATAVHGIRDEDVRGKAPAWNDVEYAGFAGYFHGLALGDAGGGGADGSTGPAIFCGHNAAESDVSWATSWGYLPDADLDVVDTMRLARRIAREHPFPLSPDFIEPFGDEQAAIVPAFGGGLDAFASSLVGVHYGLTNARHEAHGALADCCATARSLARLLDLWSPLWPPRRTDLPPAANLSALLACLGAPPPGQVSWDGWLAEAEGGGFTWRRGKHKGKPFACDLSYAKWVTTLPRRPTGIDGEAWCSQHTADVLASGRR